MKATLNTREREEILKVMDALANALRQAEMDLESEGIGNETANRAALAAYDALLIEGSASSEGAEAVGYLNVRRFRGVDSMVNHDFEYTGNLPDGSYPVYTNPQPAQGEHEQRSSEGSELRPIADEVVERVLHAADGSCHEFAQVKAVLEALPRGLPAGSDAKEDSR